MNRFFVSFNNKRIIKKREREREFEMKNYYQIRKSAMYLYGGKKHTM